MKKHQKGFAPVLILFVLVVLGVGVYFGRNLIQENSQLKKVASIPVPTPSPTSALTSVDTKDWKTYMNNKYKFSIKHPKEWRQEEREELKDLVLLTSESIDMKGKQEQGVSIHVIVNSDHLTSREYFDKVIVPTQEGSVCKDFKVNTNIPASLKDLDVTIVEGLCGIFNEGPRMFVSKEGNIISISSGFLEVDNELIYKILSTFIFTN